MRAETSTDDTVTVTLDATPPPDGRVRVPLPLRTLLQHDDVFIDLVLTPSAAGVDEAAVELMEQLDLHFVLDPEADAAASAPLAPRPPARAVLDPHASLSTQLASLLL